MAIGFVTTNTHKFEEVSALLNPYGVEVEQIDMSYEENHDASLEEIATGAARKLADELSRPIVLEDTGLFFEAYDGFPGALPKFVINTLGFKGIFKLLEGEPRGAYFKTVAAYCEPGKEPAMFEGIMRGQITEKIYDEEKDVMPYEKIFIPEGRDIPISSMTRADKNTLSHRARAFRAFGEYTARQQS